MFYVSLSRLMLGLCHCSALQRRRRTSTAFTPVKRTKQENGDEMKSSTNPPTIRQTSLCRAAQTVDELETKYQPPGFEPETTHPFIYPPVLYAVVIGFGYIVNSERWGEGASETSPMRLKSDRKSHCSLRMSISRHCLLGDSRPTVHCMDKIFSQLEKKAYPNATILGTLTAQNTFLCLYASPLATCSICFDGCMLVYAPL